MNVKKNLITLVLFLLLGVGLYQVQAQTASLILKFQDNTQKATELSLVRKITFVDGNLVLIPTIGTTESYAVSQLSKLFFSNLSGVNNISAKQPELIVYPNPVSNYISLKNAPDGALNVIIFQLDGSVVKTELLTSSAQLIDVTMLTKGFHILKVNNQAIKFTKQ